MPLLIELSYRKMQINFDTHDNDLIIDFVLEMTIRYDMDDPRTEGLEDVELLYDEIPVIFGMDMDIEDDVLWGHINLMGLDIDPKYGQISYPKSNGLDLTTNEYVRFLYGVSYMLEDMQNYLNEVDLRNGVPFPYDTDEFYSSILFKEDVVYLMLELQDTAWQYVDIDADGPLPFDTRNDDPYYEDYWETW